MPLFWYTVLMRNLFRSPFGQSYLGCDIGTTTIKIVELASGGQDAQPVLRNYALLESFGHFNRANDAIQTSSLKIVDITTVQLLKEMLAKAQFKTKDVIASLPAFSAFITMLEIPDMPEEDTVKTLSFQIHQHIPLPISEVTIDWVRLGTFEDDKGFTKQQILLVSVPNEFIKKYQSIFDAAGLHLKALEVESVSLVRALTEANSPPTLLVDIGSQSTNIVVVDKGFLRTSLQTDFASTALTQAIAKGLGISMRRAEDLKRQKGLLARGGEYELSTLTLPFLDAIISEAKRVQAQYEKPDAAGNSAHKLERVLLAGGGAALLGIEQYMQEALGIPTSVASALSRVAYPPKLSPVSRELGPKFAVAIGLGLKGFETR